jgi:rhodanese-related sulfurtransferase
MHSQHPLAGAVWIVVVGAGLGIGYNALRPQALPWVYSPPPMIQLDDGSTGSATPAVGEAPAPAGDTGSARTPTGADPTQSAPTQTAAPGTVKPTDPAVPVGEAPGRDRVAPSSETPATSAPAPSAAPAQGGSNPAVGQAAVTEGKDLYPDIPQSVNMMEVGLAKAKAFYDRGGLLILDARDAVDFADGHIKGAVSAPYDDVVGDPDLMTKYAQDPRPILCYCSGGECELSMDLGEELTRTGHRRVLVLKEGYPGWKDAGYPVVEGDSK